MTEKLTKLERMLREENPNNDEIDEAIMKDIGYSWKQMEMDVEHLKEWLKDQHHLPECRLKETDEFFTNYLSGSKGSVDAVKRKIDAYYSLRGKSEIYRNKDPLDEGYKRACEAYHLAILPKFTDTGDCIFISTLVGKEIYPGLMVNFMKRIINMNEVGLRLQRLTRSAITIINHENYTQAHITMFSPALFKDVLHITQNVFPQRMKKIILINVPSYLEIILNTVMKPFLSKKLKDRFFVYSEGWEAVFQHVDKSRIPKDCGGDYHLTLKEINDTMCEYERIKRDWYINELSEETDETKRVNTDFKYSEDSFFGVQGTLKKLAID